MGTLGLYNMALKGGFSCMRFRKHFLRGLNCAAPFVSKHMLSTAPNSLSQLNLVPITAYCSILPHYAGVGAGLAPPLPLHDLVVFGWSRLRFELILTKKAAL